MTYAAAKARFKTSTRVVASALSRAPTEWRATLTKAAPGNGDPSEAGRFEHVTVEIVEHRAGRAVSYKTREEGAEGWTALSGGETLGLVLDALAGEKGELVAVLYRGRGEDPGTWSYLAVFKRAA